MTILPSCFSFLALFLVVNTSVQGLTLAVLSPRSSIVAAATPHGDNTGRVEEFASPLRSTITQISTATKQPACQLSVTDHIYQSRADEVIVKYNNNINDTHLPQHLASQPLHLALLLLTACTALPTTAAAAAFTIAAGESTGAALQSAALAYLHYTSLLVCVSALVVQRCLVQPNMSPKQEDTLMTTETFLGVGTVALLLSGIFRIELEQGLDFYTSHEPLFWLKVILTAVWGGTSLFPSTIISQRYFERKNASPTQPQQQPISEALAARMKQLLNVGLTAMFTIPFVATLMARGVLYTEDFPWPVGVVITTAVWVGLSIKYVKEAKSWQDPPTPIDASTESESLSAASK